MVILDGNNETYAVFNLTTYDLSDSDNYETLKALLIAAAAEL